MRRNGKMTQTLPYRRRPIALLSMWLLSVGFATACGSSREPQASDHGPQYVDGNRLVRPADYREWPFLGSGLGLTYDEEAASPDASPNFTNVFVNPSSYRAFMQSGTWPDGSVFVLEIRRSQTDAPPNAAGRFQGELAFLEAEVKDPRFPDGWGFFQFGPGGELSDEAAPLADEAAAPCVECHTNETAVERTFVQFYPTLLEVARAHGTLKPGF